MKVADNAFVAIDYKLSLDSGDVVDQSEPGKPLGFLFGCGQLIPGLERQLTGMEQGESTQLTIEADDGYGQHQEELIRRIPRANFPEGIDIEKGMVFQGQGPQGPIAVRVAGTEGDDVIADFNHPLAGERLHFDVTVAEVREPTEQELAALRAGPECAEGGCQGCGMH
jgi:FKBP-type peptidyl-prolyl cis-trans isomerase SlyD